MDAPGPRVGAVHRGSRARADSIARGRLIATALGGAWRACPPEPCLSAAELAAVTPLLRQSGGASLAWWAVRRSPLRRSRAAAELRRTYRFDAISATFHDRDVQRVFRTLEQAGVEPLLAKGWAAARFYPEAGLRSYDDIDVLVPAEQRARAAAVLQPDPVWDRIDLHARFAELADRSLSDLYRRSVVLSAGEVAVRVLGPEDHLRLLCQHLLRHGAWRVGWLCDIGAAVESLPSDFDWDYCLSGDPRRSEWLRCTLALAARLLGARLEVPKPDARGRPMPSWLIPAVLAEWGRLEPHRSPTPLADILRKSYGSRQPLEELRCRWPNPIVATVFWHAAFAQTPRFPLQLANYLASAALAALGKTPTQA